MLDLADGQLEEPLTHRAEARRLAGGEEPVVAVAVGRVLEALLRERLRDLARGLVGAEDEPRRAAEDALEGPLEQRVVRAPEDDRVDPRLLQRLRIRAHGRLAALGVELVGLDQRDEIRARDRDELDAGVERVHELGVASGGDGSLGRHQADATVPGRLHGGVRLRRDHADHGHAELLLQLRQRG